MPGKIPKPAVHSKPRRWFNVWSVWNLSVFENTFPSPPTCVRLHCLNFCFSQWPSLKFERTNIEKMYKTVRIKVYVLNSDTTSLRSVVLQKLELQLTEQNMSTSLMCIQNMAHGSKSRFTFLCVILQFFLGLQRFIARSSTTTINSMPVRFLIWSIIVKTSERLEAMLVLYSTCVFYSNFLFMWESLCCDFSTRLLFQPGFLHKLGRMRGKIRLAGQNFYPVRFSRPMNIVSCKFKKLPKQCHFGLLS